MMRYGRLQASRFPFGLAPQTLYTNTSSTGGFGFEGLQPGTYFVKAHKAGYFDIQSAAEVVAGVNDPKLVKISMQTDTSFRKPYVQPQQLEGYVECTTSVLAACGAANFAAAAPCIFGLPCVENATNDRFGLYVYYDANASMIQSEMVWDSSQALSVELTLEMENTGFCDAPGDTYVQDVTGPSPIYNKLDQKDVESVPFGGSCPIFHSVFSGDTQGTPLGVTASQPFTIYSHSFYGFLPADGWRFTVDGTPTPPQ